MASCSVRRWRQLALWLHVTTSVAWMAQALAIFVLLTTSLTTDSQAVAVSATSMAQVLDGRLLAPMANASAFTGFMLAAATGWGFFRYRWVLVKFVITLTQLHLGIFVLSSALADSATAAATGTRGPAVPLAVGSALMAGAIAFQAWVSVAKPWSTTRWMPEDRRQVAGTAPRWVFVATVVGVAADLTIAGLLGHPAPLISLAILGTWLVLRRRQSHTSGHAGGSPALR
ncbi:hypothetical protein E1258_16215 [Micromonospora sp. KC207]|uniref:hypothetical protein n=1 Tax=Micromonospora sp. KC207 TaxID=2530377 RepID=UPI0010468515|nr:hypothetical protein [Micromonospora sp. KC207]TDC59939.1 hypothetical protein E1258_16215 [Micromonospora sp. KC207]